MSFKEVQSLRKSGNLDEAYILAKKDLKNQSDKWSYSALYWVLNDQSKQLIEQQEYKLLSKKINEMESIIPLIDDPEGIAQKCLNSLHKKSNPEFENIQKAIQLSKENKITEAINLFRDIANRNALPEYYHESYGWAIYKQFYQRLKKMDSITCRTLLRDYLRLQNIRPSHLHSLIMLQAIRISEQHNDFRILPFFKLWGTDSFTPEDWLPSETNNKTYTPRAQKIIEKIFDTLKTEKYAAAAEFIDLFKLASLKLSDSKFIKRKYAILLSASGHKDEARKLYISLLKEYNEWYIWHELSSLIPEPEMRLSCLCKALSKTKIEDYIGEVRLHAAEAFLNLGFRDEAARELALYAKNRDKNNWTKNDMFKRLSQQVSFENVRTNRYTNYSQFTKACETLIYNDFPTHKVILISKFKDNNDKDKCRFSDKTGEITFICSQNLFTDLRVAREGDAFECRLKKEISEKNSFYRVLTLQKITIEDHSELFYTNTGIIISMDEERMLYKAILRDGQFINIPFKYSRSIQKNDIVEISYIKGINGRNKKILISLRIEKQTEQKCNFTKQIEGPLKVVEKTNGTSVRLFGFIDDCYIPAHIITPFRHLEGTTLKARAFTNGEKWQVYELSSK